MPAYGSIHPPLTMDRHVVTESFLPAYKQKPQVPLIPHSMVASTPRFAAAIAACLLARSNAFAPSSSSSLAARRTASNSLGRPLFAEGGDGPQDGTTITSARKEIGYDATSGRFFETDIDPEDCIPDNEYCVVDKDSGAMVRLTLVEKERIFLDALQVRTLNHGFQFR